MASQMLRSEAEFVRSAMGHADTAPAGAPRAPPCCTAARAALLGCRCAYELVAAAAPLLRLLACRCAAVHHSLLVRAGQGCAPGRPLLLHQAMEEQLAHVPSPRTARPPCSPPARLRPADYTAAWEAVARDIIWAPSQQRYTRAASATAAEKAASLQAEFEGVRREMEKEAKRAQKLEQRVRAAAGLGEHAPVRHCRCGVCRRAERTTERRRPGLQACLRLQAAPRRPRRLICPCSRRCLTRFCPGRHRHRRPGGAPGQAARRGGRGVGGAAHRADRAAVLPVCWGGCRAFR